MPLDCSHCAQASHDASCLRDTHTIPELHVMHRDHEVCVGDKGGMGMLVSIRPVLQLPEKCSTAHSANSSTFANEVVQPPCMVIPQILVRLLGGALVRRQCCACTISLHPRWACGCGCWPLATHPCGAALRPKVMRALPGDWLKCWWLRSCPLWLKQVP